MLSLHSEPGRNGNEGVLHIPQSCTIQEPHYHIVYRHIRDIRWRGFNYFAEMQSEHSTALTDWRGYG